MDGSSSSLPYGQPPPRAPPPSSSSSCVADEEGGDWYVHAQEEGGSTQGPMSRAEAARWSVENAAGKGGGGGRLMVWHPAETKAWTPWNEVRGSRASEGDDASPGGGFGSKGMRPGPSTFLTYARPIGV